MRRKEERSKQGQTNNKAEQHPAHPDTIMYMLACIALSRGWGHAFRYYLFPTPNLLVLFTTFTFNMYSGEIVFSHATHVGYMYVHVRAMCQVDVRLPLKKVLVIMGS